MDNVELIVIANGCTDNTKEYVSILNAKLVWFDEPIGFTKATNEGIKASTGEYLLIANNDIVILDFYSKDEWLEELTRPFLTDDKVAITGTNKMADFSINYTFIPFLCAMIPRKIIEKFGYLDEIFSPGYGEDIDYCVKVQQGGYKIIQVPVDNNFSYSTTFPIWHRGEGTMHSPLTEWTKIAKESKWSDIIERNMNIILQRYRK